MRQEIRLVLAGDAGVGKSTLITSLIKEAYVADVQRKVPELALPADVSPEGISTKIVDTLDDLETELRRASVVLLVYSVVDAESFERITSYWLPYLRSLGVNAPVVLVGAQVDRRTEEEEDDALEEAIAPIMAEFKEVETCIETSARLALNVSEAFYYAQKAVLYPTAPLYDPRMHTLKPACIEALTRIFLLCDSDKDGLLHDDDLHDFQRMCFHAPLSPEALDEIKYLVMDGAEVLEQPPLVRHSLTLTGFLYMHTLFIQRGRLETTWVALWTFGYGMDLALRHLYVHPPYAVPAGMAVELSPNGYQFLTELFKAHDKDHDGALNHAELATLFATAPNGQHPWDADEFPESTVTDDAGAVTLQGWLAQWSMTTWLDHRTTLAYLAYLGYPLFAHPLPGTAHAAAPGSGTALYRSSPPTSYAWQDGTVNAARRPGYVDTPASTPSALRLVRRRKPSDRKKHGSEQGSVFSVLVLGAPGSGKTSVLRNFVGKPFTTQYTPTVHPRRAVCAVEQGGAERYLILQECGADQEATFLRAKLSGVDAVAFVYDSSDTNSFSYISNLRNQYPVLSTVPSLFVATKSDLDLAQQRHEVQPDVYCRKLGLSIPHLGPGPLYVTARGGEMAEMYSMLVRIATDARGAIPTSPRSLKYARLRRHPAPWVVLSVVGAAGTAWVAWLWVQKSMPMPTRGVQWWARYAAR